MLVQADLITTSGAGPAVAIAVEPQFEVVIELRPEVVSRTRAECGCKWCSKTDPKYTHSSKYFFPVSLAHILVDAVTQIQRISTSVAMISTKALYWLIKTYTSLTNPTQNKPTSAVTPPASNEAPNA